MRAPADAVVLNVAELSVGSVAREAEGHPLFENREPAFIVEVDQFNRLKVFDQGIRGFLNLPRDLILWPAFEGEREAHVFGHRHRLNQFEVLVDHADTGFDGLFSRGKSDRPSFKIDDPAIGLRLSRQQRHQR